MLNLSFKFCIAAALCILIQVAANAKDRVVAAFLQLSENDTFIFQINPIRKAPCKLYGIELYDIKKCSEDKKTIDEFSKFYKEQIYRFIKPGLNFYLSSSKNLGDRWLCEVADSGKILNKTLVINSLAKPTAKDYKKLKIKESKSELEKKFPEIFACLSGKKDEPVPPPPSEPEPQLEVQESEPKVIIDYKDVLGKDFGKDFGE